MPIKFRQSEKVFKKDGPKIAPVKHYYIKQTPTTELIDNINKVISDNNFTPTNNPRPCSYCDHAASGVCGTGVFRNSKSRNR